MHTGSVAVNQSQHTPLVNIQQTRCADPTLLPVTNPTLSLTITAEIPITANV